MAILFPHEANLRHALSLSQDPAVAHVKSADIATLCDDSYVQHIVLNACNEVGTKNGLNGSEVLCGVVLTPEEWTPETGLVSAAMKIKRAAVASTFSKEIEVMPIVNRLPQLTLLI